ncbi:MAG TPA: DNA polymerase III subunit delta [bacterium]|nr:DNA polymerase III subunit delta [bacterium]
MNLTELRKKIASGDVRPCYILAGAETYLQREAASFLKEKIVTDPMSYEKYSGRETGLPQVVESASMMPFFGGKKLIVVDPADPYLKDAEQFLSYITDPSPYACVVFCVSAIDKRTKAYKEADRQGIVVACDPLYPNQLQAWSADYFRKAGKSVDADALSLFVEHAGTVLQDVVSEAEKLILYAGERGRISFADVDCVVVRVRTEDVFELTNAIGGRDKKKALALLVRLMQEGKDAFELVGLLRWQLVRLFQADEMFREGKGEQEVAGAFKVYPKYAGDFFRNVRSFSRLDKAACLSLLLDADVSIKKGLRDEAAAMERLIIALCR